MPHCMKHLRVMQAGSPPPPPSGVYQLLSTGSLRPRHPHHPYPWARWFLWYKQQGQCRAKRPAKRQRRDRQHQGQHRAPGHHGAVSHQGQQEQQDQGQQRHAQQSQERHTQQEQPQSQQQVQGQQVPEQLHAELQQLLMGPLSLLAPQQHLPPQRQTPQLPAPQQLQSPHQPKQQQQAQQKTQQKVQRQPKRQQAQQQRLGKAATVTSALGALQSSAVAATGHEPALTFNSNRFAATLDYVWMTPASVEAVGWLCMPWEWFGLMQKLPRSQVPAVGELERPEDASWWLALLPNDKCEWGDVGRGDVALGCVGTWWWWWCIAGLVLRA